MRWSTGGWCAWHPQYQTKLYVSFFLFLKVFIMRCVWAACSNPLRFRVVFLRLSGYTADLSHLHTGALLPHTMVANSPDIIPAARQPESPVCLALVKIDRLAQDVQPCILWSMRLIVWSSRMRKSAHFSALPGVSHLLQNQRIFHSMRTVSECQDMLK